MTPEDARLTQPERGSAQTISKPDAGGAADKASTRLVQVQPCQLSVSEPVARPGTRLGRPQVLLMPFVHETSGLAHYITIELENLMAASPER